MKLSRKQTGFRTRKLPELQFVDQKLSSFSGVLLFQALFANLDLRNRLRACFPKDKGSAYGAALLFLGLITHILLGHRKLREMESYSDDPLVLRLVGWTRWPDVATFSRALARITESTLERLRKLCCELVLERLAGLQLPRITLDFDGSVLGTGRHAEGTAVGFNSRKKGQRSYYPLFCTLAQTGQIFDFLHRAGNVHDSKGAEDFIRECIRRVREVLPGVIIEVRMDGAFFSDAVVSMLLEEQAEFTISVPFARFVELKKKIEARRRWAKVNEDTSAFELRWKPKKWKRKARFLVIRQVRRIQKKGPLQLDLYEPQADGYTFKVVVTNKTLGARAVAKFHEGRGTQEAVFGELKSDGQMDYVPVRTLAGNQAYMLAAILAHNLSRELQMATMDQQRGTTPKRAPRWKFQRLSTLRRRWIQRAGRLIRPKGVLTLVMGVNTVIQREIEAMLGRLQAVPVAVG